jgi:hypothetical protein
LDFDGNIELLTACGDCIESSGRYKTMFSSISGGHLPEEFPYLRTCNNPVTNYFLVSSMIEDFDGILAVCSYCYKEVCRLNQELSKEEAIVWLIQNM